MRFFSVGERVTAKQDLIKPAGYGPFTVSKLRLHRFTEKTGLYELELREDQSAPKHRYWNTLFES